MMRFDHAMCIEEFSIEFFKTYSDNVKLYDGRTQKSNTFVTHVNGERARYIPIQFLNVKIQIKTIEIKPFAQYNFFSFGNNLD